ncbi:hypothetical protein [Pengzhenrongella sicca]|uniref:Uncharacterized protein n=1 Tax=Pengzhenrongella sicca TaxID=2819238 RepID=A0A8A4ZAN8_9MICO|nr:hypothetical protein [Pengzhenrongella sicca]QTE28089.1 hypothetical protein J4E96_11875 [Pengzhenrongella sicca]
MEYPEPGSMADGPLQPDESHHEASLRLPAGSPRDGVTLADMVHLSQYSLESGAREKSDLIARMLAVAGATVLELVVGGYLVLEVNDGEEIAKQNPKVHASERVPQRPDLARVQAKIAKRRIFRRLGSVLASASPDTYLRFEEAGVTTARGEGGVRQLTRAGIELAIAVRSELDSYVRYQPKRVDPMAVSMRTAQLGALIYASELWRSVYPVGEARNDGADVRLTELRDRVTRAGEHADVWLMVLDAVHRRTIDSSQGTGSIV